MNSIELEATDHEVRRVVYDTAMSTGTLPRLEQIMTALNLSIEETRGAVQRLAAGHILVLENDTDEILMANPFSAVPTPFLVETNQFNSFGNCIWDALGIAAMLKVDARIRTSCPDCGSAMLINLMDGAVFGNGIIHFAVPARLWWQNIVFT